MSRNYYPETDSNDEPTAFEIASDFNLFRDYLKPHQRGDIRTYGDFERTPLGDRLKIVENFYC